MPFFILIILCLSACNNISASENMEAAALAKQIASHHGTQAWMEHKALKAHVRVQSGDKTIIDHNFSFQINGAQARMDSSDGTTVIYDGKQAWAQPASDKAPKGRFHVLTWPWFIRAPFTVQQPWQELGPVSKYTQMPDTTALYSKQTFAAGTGDTPDDWYGMLVDPDSGQLLGMNYIVTYGKMLDKANQKISQINYHDYKTIDGCRISTRWTLYHLNPETLQRQGKPKATATVSEISFFTPPDDWFTPGRDAQLLKLPEVNQQQ